MRYKRLKTIINGEDLAIWRQKAKNLAQQADIDPSEVDWFVQALTELDRLSLRLESFRSQIAINCPYSVAQLSDLWQRRLDERIPVQYLVGKTPWRDLTLKVTPDVLIPRPETEYIIDLAMATVRENSGLMQGHWVDLGTGSGAIAIALAKAFPKAKIHAVDQSEKALIIAQENAQSENVCDRIHFYHGSWWSPLTAFKGKIRGLISNPPYIPQAMIANLQPEVLRHEPQMALDGGEDGLEAIRYLVESSPDYLQSGGIWLIEMMAGQGESVAQLLKANGNYDNIEIIDDLARRDRFALAYRR